MADLSSFNPNQVSNPNNNIFGLPFTEEEASLILFPVPWEVTVATMQVQQGLENIFLMQRCKLTYLMQSAMRLGKKYLYDAN
jgi:hypothetical protein